MKTSILLLLVAFSVPLFAQTPFAPIGAQWTYTQGSWSGPDTNIATVEVVGDTALAGHTYSVLEATSGWFICYELIQYLRTSNDSTFFWDPATLQEQLLFRWNAVPGDTWETPIAPTGMTDTLDWTVTDTGTVIINGTVLRTINADPLPRNSPWYLTYGGKFTEKLGPPAMPFTWINGICDAETFNNLRCYSDPEISWLNPQFPQCELSTGIDENIRSAGMRITPNLIERGESVRVTLVPSMIGPSTMEIRDALGKLLRAFPINAATTEVQLEVPGVLFMIAVTHDGTRITRRVMVR